MFDNSHLLLIQGCVKKQTEKQYLDEKPTVARLFAMYIGFGILLLQIKETEPTAATSCHTHFLELLYSLGLTKQFYSPDVLLKQVMLIPDIPHLSANVGYSPD
jgi:phage terminase large subunit